MEGGRIIYPCPLYLIQGSHGSRGRGDNVVDEEEQGILRPQANPFPYQEIELSYSQV